MNFNLIEENGYKYIEEGEGFPIIVLHGLMGNLSNFNEVTNFFRDRNFKVIMPVLPIYDLPLLKTEHPYGSLSSVRLKNQDRVIKFYFQRNRSII